MKEFSIQYIETDGRTYTTVISADTQDEALAEFDRREDLPSIELVTLVKEGDATARPRVFVRSFVPPGIGPNDVFTSVPAKLAYTPWTIGFWTADWRIADEKLSDAELLKHWRDFHAAGLPGAEGDEDGCADAFYAYLRSRGYETFVMAGDFGLLFLPEVQ